MNANTIYNSMIGGLSNTYFNLSASPEANNFLSVLSNTIYSLLNASGDAPIYSCRAWAKAGDGNTLIVGKNVSSVSEPSSSQKRFNFTIGPANTDYAAVCQTIHTGQRFGTIIDHTNTYCTFSFSDDASVNDSNSTMFLAFW